MPAVLPANLVAVGERVGARIDALLAAELERWEAVDASLGEALQSLRAFLAAGGKRLRPAFCYCGFVAAGGDPHAESVIDAGAALEMVHTCALVHDDVIDGSTRRRGMACVHVDYADRHRVRGWRGDRQRFGAGAATLIGDLAHVYADVLMRDAPPPAVDVFNELRLEVNAGQFLDLVGAAGGSPTTEQAHTICIYKSGKYTVERPLHLGAALAGRLDDLAAPFTEFGLPLGEAFQLKDDLLGAFGDRELLGKDVGEDFRDGKATALIAFALAKADGKEAELLRDRVGRPDLTTAAITEIQQVLVKTGARQAIEERVDELVTRAVEAIARAPIVDWARAELEALATFVARRDR